MFWRRRVAEDLERDIQEHIAIETDDNIARGMTPDEARYAALRKFGNVTRTIEDTRGVWIWNWLDTLSGDVRQAFRKIRKSPGTSALVVSSLALAFIPSVTFFSVMDRMLLASLPVRAPHEIIQIQFKDVRPEADYRFQPISYPEVHDFQRSLHTVSGVAYERRQGVMALINGRRVALWAALVNDDFFSVLGIPIQGAAGSARDRQSVVISHGLWQREFGGQPGVINQTVLLSGQRFTIAGIATAEFRGTERHIGTDFWIPMETWLTLQPRFRTMIERRDARDGTLWARLRPGVAMTQATAEVESVSRDLAREWPGTNRHLVGYTFDGIGDRGRVGRVLASFGVFLLGLVLAVACANVAGVLLARTEERRHETAVRQALGASRFRLIRAWVIESLALASIAAALGLVGARVLIGALPDLLPSLPMPIRFDFSLGPRVWLYVAVMVGVSALSFSLIPAWRGSRPDVLAGLRKDAAIHVLRFRVPLRSLLIVGQVAVAEALLFVAGLVLTNLWSVQQLDPGIDPNRTIAMVMVAPVTGDGGFRPLDRDAVSARLAQLGGVRGVAYGNSVPLSGSIGPALQIELPGQPARSVHGGSVGPGFFPMLGVKLLSGRDLRESDQHSILVNASLARLVTPTGSAVGRQIRVDGTLMEIVGIFQDAGWKSPGEQPRPRLVTLGAPRGGGETTFAIELGGNPADYLALLRSEFARSAPECTVLSVKTLAQHYEDALYLERMATKTLYVLGLIALLLTATGLHGITRTLFARRTREFSIRLALGAHPSQVVRTVLFSTLSLVAIGVALGLAIAASLAAVAGAQVHGFVPWSAMAWGLSTAIVVSAALVAAAQPAWRVLAIRPADALRSE